MSTWRVPLSDVVFGDEEIRAVVEVLRSGWITLGEQVRSFEVEFARLCGVRDAVAVASGTAALHLAFLALDVGPGDEVIVPSLSFVATANAVVLAGGRPVFADSIGPDDFTIDPEDVERRITRRTVGVVAMHYGGHPCDLDALAAICERHGLFLVEDAAHAPGGRWRDRAVGTIGDAGCFSFFGNKNMTTGEGGMVIARDSQVLERVRLLRSHGMTALSWDRYAGHAWSYDVLGPGLNYRVTEITGALGRVQLSRLPENNQRRNDLLGRYRQQLAGVEGISMPFTAKSGTAHLCVVLLADPKLQAPLRKALAEAGIQTSLHYPPIHLFAHYRQWLGTGPGDAPTAEFLAARSVSLPLYPTLPEPVVDEICGRIGSFVAEATR